MTHYYLSLEDEERLHKFASSLENSQRFMLGYPVASDIQCPEFLPFFKWLINNVGDPFVDPLYALHSKSFEREILAFFADLFRAPEKYWGYVTSGGTEANMYALLSAREQFPEGILYYSDATHYSIAKIAFVLRIQAIAVKTTEKGEMDYADLRQHINLNKDKPAIVVANIGTTMTEAKDDIHSIQYVMQQEGKKDFYIHCDAAMSGAYASFLQPRPAFDLSDGADSISVSGHKFLGCPLPCGILIAKSSCRSWMEQQVSYIASSDTTLSGSRDGHAIIYLWCVIRSMGKEGLKSRLQYSLQTADYLLRQLQVVGIESWRNPGAITVMIKNLDQNIIRKWQLATQNGWSHIICMPSVERDRIDEFLMDCTNAHTSMLSNRPHNEEYAVINAA